MAGGGPTSRRESYRSKEDRAVGMEGGVAVGGGSMSRVGSGKLMGGSQGEQTDRMVKMRV